MEVGGEVDIRVHLGDHLQVHTYVPPPNQDISIATYLTLNFLMSLNQVSAGGRQWCVEEEIHDLIYFCDLGLLKGWPCPRTDTQEGKAVPQGSV